MDLLNNRVLTCTFVTLLSSLASPAFASLIPVDLSPSSGNGIGAVNTSITFQNTGSESGCVSPNVATGGCAVMGFTGADEKPGGSQTNLYTASQLSLTNFSNLAIVFNGNQTGSSPGITLNALGLTLYSSSGAVLQTFTAPSLPTTYSAFSGIGNAGFGFKLDATQAAQANALFATNPNLLIGTEANASGANGGPETIQLTKLAGSGGGGGGGGGGEVPEPGTVLTLASGLALLVIAPVRKRLAARK